jgi:hypothetical protein
MPLRAAKGGTKHPPVSASRGQFHEKIRKVISASFSRQTQPPESSYFLSNVFLACVYGARGRHTTAQMKSRTTASVECVEAWPFSAPRYTLLDPKLAVESISEVSGASKAHCDVVNRAVP